MSVPPSRKPRSFSMRCLFFLICAVAAPIVCSAQIVEKMENRFLFVVETTSSMARSTDEVRRVVVDLITSGMQGQLQKGDTIGLWTYNDKLNTDFPMQTWSDTDKEGILSTVKHHLQFLHYAKKGKLERIMPAILSVVQASHTMTVVLITDGDDEIHGTKFDPDINNLHKEYQRELKSSHLPFVTVLAARGGEVFDYTVNSSLGPIRVPKTAEPKKVEAAPKPQTNTVAPKPMRVVVIGAPATPTPPATNAATVQPELTAPPVTVPPPAKPAPAPIVEPTTRPAAVIPAESLAAPANQLPSTPTAPLPASAQPVAATPPPPVPAPAPKPSPAPMPATPATVVTPAPVAPPPQPAEAVAAQPVTAVAPAGSWGIVVLLSVACSLLAVACVIIFFLSRNLRRKEDSSLISQSMRRQDGER